MVTYGASMACVFQVVALTTRHKAVRIDAFGPRTAVLY
jgi:hypothetical protein